MPSFLRRPTLLAVLPIAAVLAVVLLLGGGLSTADAQAADIPAPTISLDPSTDTNTVGDKHTVKATLTVEGQPLVGVRLMILVVDGPNADVANSIIDQTDAAGQVSLTYTGDGGPGKDDIGAVACIVIGTISDPGSLGEEPVPPEECSVEIFEAFVEGCLADEARDFDCLAFLGDPEAEGGCAKDVGARREIYCDVAEKTWVEPTATPTPTPSPTATPTPTPTVLAAVQTPTPTPTPVVLAAAALPRTGGEPSDGGSGVLPWLVAIAGAMAMMGAGGVLLAYQRRRVR